MFRRSSMARWLLVSLVAGTSLGIGLAAHDERDALAVGTRTFDLDTQDRLSGGDQKGTAITSGGEVVAGWTTARTSLVKANAVFASLALADGSVLLGTAPEGRVIKVDANGKETVVAETGATAVTALAYGPGGKIYAGSMPDGEIFIVDPSASVGVNPSAPPARKAKPWTKIEGSDSTHVWALVYDQKRNELFAGTGPDGKIYRVDAAGKSQLFYTADDTQIVSLALSPSGTLYAGTSSKALLLAINAAGRAEVVYDFPGHEVKAIAFGPTDARAAKPAPKPATKGAKVEAGAGGESVYVIVNEYPSAPEPSRRSGASTRAPSSAYEPPRPSRGKGELWRFTGLAADGSNGKPERLFRDDGATLLALATDPTPRTTPEGEPIVAYVGTGSDGRVIAVDDVHGTAVVAKSDARQIAAIGVPGGAGKGAWFATSDAASVHRVTGIGGADSTWTSKVLDAGLLAHWGKLTWRASTANAVELQTRSGNTAAADDTWSAWSTALAAPAKAGSPAARYVQIRARWKGNEAAALRGVSLSFVTENLRAIVTEVNVPTHGSLSTGLVSSGTEVPSKSGSLRLSWHADNPDGDALRYRLWYRREDSTIWRPITREDEPISGTEHSWNTESLAEGWYRVRVEASDEIANPFGAATKHALESTPFIVDNTPPVIRKIALVGGRLQAEIADGIGPISRVEIMIDGRSPWRPVTSSDGILDDAVETIDAPLGLTGAHVVALRAFDAAGNMASREVEGK